MTSFDEGLFRKAAIEHYLQGEEGAGPLRVSPPWTWALFWTLVGALVLALLLGIFGSVEVTGRGRGILRPQGGIQVLNAAVAGTVVQVPAVSGQGVKAGQVVLRLDSASLQSQLLEAQRQLSLLQSEHRAYTLRQDRFRADEEATLKARMAMLTEQEASQRESVNLYVRKVNANQELKKADLVSAIALEEAKEAQAQAQRQWMMAQQALVQARQELASLKGRWEDDLWRREMDLRQAQSRCDALQISLAQTVVTAPRDGMLEALLVKPGDVLAVGQPVGRLVAREGALSIVAFLPEKDRAFVKAGDTARLELDQHPYAEFGTLKAKVLRIASDLASSQEIQEALGEAGKLEGAAYRVELELPERGRTDIPIRTGMLMNIRFTLRRQRPLAIFIEPLRRWLD
ncbi:MAG TPA: HlyD family efflux transporter periplasmic adaptor subunit [Holophagaceae bacterium]|nr:HlyD family efflux transporter periplasmic adaptor subunit [Holophagaceae bacterium]